MRSFTPKTIVIAALLAAAPLGTAFAANNAMPTPQQMRDSDDHPIDVTKPLPHSERLNALLGQVQSVSDGLKAQADAKQMSPSEFKQKQAEASAIRKTAENVAAKNHGQLPAGQYRDLLRQIGGIDPDPAMSNDS